MVASIGVIASPFQGVSYYERDGYYAKDDPAHLEASAWAGEGAGALGLSGPVDPDIFKAVLEGRVLSCSLAMFPHTRASFVLCCLGTSPASTI